MFPFRISKAFLVAVLICIVAFAVRVPGLGSFMTVDEENWTLRSAEFYHKLFRNGDIKGTFLTTHPGATAMWIAGAGITFQEKRVGFDVDTSNLEHFRLAATLPIVAVISVLIGIIAILLTWLWSWRVGLWGGLLVALDPYFSGMGQVVHLDALLSVFMLLAVLSMLLFVQRGDKRFVLLSALCTGFALGTKLLPSLWLFVFVTVLFAYLVFSQREKFLAVVQEYVVALIVYACTSFLILTIIWPAFSTVPDFNTGYIGRDTESIVSDDHVAIEISEDPIEPVTFYMRTVVGRTTPFVLVILFAYLILRLRDVIRIKNIQMPEIDWLFIYSIGFLILVTFVAKKSDRYGLPALISMNVITGVIVGTVLKSRMSMIRNRFIRIGIPIFLGVLLFAQIVRWSPYAIAYSNPIFPNVRPFSQQGWGEGLDAAARYLNQHPLASDIYIASWYPGAMRPYFRGTTLSLSSRTDHRVSYIVIYRNMRGRAPDDIASNVLDELKGQKPEHVIEIGGVPYVWIYATKNTGIYRDHVGEIVGDFEVGQVIPVQENSWDTIDIGFANFSNRDNTKDVILHVRESVDATEDIRTVRVNASDIEDSVFYSFTFDPIIDSAGKTFYVAITSPESVPGNAVTVRFSKEDVSPGQLLLRRRGLREKEINSQFLRGGDIAYRIQEH